MSISGSSVIRTQWGDTFDFTPKPAKPPSPSPRHGGGNPDNRQHAATMSSFGNPAYFTAQAVGSHCTQITPKCPTGEAPDKDDQTCRKLLTLDPHRAMVPADPGARYVPVFSALQCDKTVCDQLDLQKGATSVVYTHHALHHGQVSSAYCVCEANGHPGSTQFQPIDSQDIDAKCASNERVKAWA